MKTILNFWFCSVFLLSFQTASAEPVPPHTVVSQATQGVITQLSQLSVDDRTDKIIEQLVTTYILPAVDEERFAKRTLGRHWVRASEEQRIAFVDAFRNRQLATFTGAFRAFDGESISFGDPLIRDNKAIVKAEFQQSNGRPPVPISFKMHLSKKTNQWLVYDLIVAGLSLGQTFRTDYAKRLQSDSLDDLIADLATVE